jgi:hypothetical protein
MLVLRSKNYSMLSRKQYYKNNWDRLKAGWIGTSKKSIDKYNKYVDTHNELERLKENNPKEFLRRYYSIDKIKKELGSVEKNIKIDLSIINKYLGCIESFAPEFGKFCKQNPEFKIEELEKTIPRVSDADTIENCFYYADGTSIPILEMDNEGNGLYYYPEKKLFGDFIEPTFSDKFHNFKEGVLNLSTRKSNKELIGLWRTHINNKL